MSPNSRSSNTSRRPNLDFEEYGLSEWIYRQRTMFHEAQVQKDTLKNYYRESYMNIMSRNYCFNVAKTQTSSLNGQM
jgi:hypothetical protein